MTKKAKKVVKHGLHKGAEVYDDSDEAEQDWSDDDAPGDPAQTKSEGTLSVPEVGVPQSQPAHNDLSPTASYKQWIEKEPAAQPPDHPYPEPEPKTGKKED